MKPMLSTVLCGLLVLACAAAQAKKEEAKKAPKPVNANCPVMDEPVDVKVTTVYNKQVIGFCCESCIDDFKKEPAKYMKKVEAEKKQPPKKDGQAAKKEDAKKKEEAVAVNKMCPVHTDDPVDPTVTTVYEGRKIGFCCDDCLKKFDADPARYAARVK